MSTTAGTSSTVAVISPGSNANLTINQTIVGGPGNDSLLGGMGDDQLFGNGGLDTLIAGSGNDSLEGGSGNDSINGGSGNDVLNGGADFDTADYGNSPGAVVADLAQGTVQDGWGTTDRLIGIEQIDGSGYNDSLLGSASGDWFSGRDGVDTFDGAGGNDEVVYGGTAQGRGVVVRLSGWVGSSGGLPPGYVGSAIDQWEKIDVFRNIEGVEGTDYDDFIVGDSASNVLDGRGGSDTIDGGAGVDTAEYNQARVGIVVDLSQGKAFNDGQGLGSAPPEAAVEVDQLISIENVWGGPGNDSIRGDALNNSLEGRDGNDTLLGEAGNDALNGGLGSDRFYMGQDAGDDSIDGGGHNTRTPWPSLLTVPNNGDDYDRLDYRNAAGGITLDLSVRTVSVSGLAGVDRYINVEEVQGSANKDTVVGTPSQGFLSNPTTGHSFFFLGLGGSDEITQTPYSNNGRLAAGQGVRWTNGLEVGYSWSDTPITINWTGNEAKVSYGAGTGAKAFTNVAYAAGVDTLRNVMNIQTTDFDDVINGQGATLNHLGYFSNSYQRISYFIVSVRGGDDVVRGNGNFILIPSVNTAGSAVPVDRRGALVDGRSADSSGLLTMDLSHLKAAYSSTVAHGVVKFSGVSYVFGTPWNDTVYAGNGIDEVRGEGGNDVFYGDDSTNRSSYRSASNAIEVNLAQGTVTDRAAGSSGNPQGGTSNGSDTLRGVETIEGTRYDDVFDARGFSESSTNGGSWGWKGMVNAFEPMGGNDTVYGNGYTGLGYRAAMLGIKADLAAGTVDALATDSALRASPDYLYSVGRTTLSGVAGIEGTDYADWLIGGTSTAFVGTTPSEIFEPRGGADTIDGVSGLDVIRYTSSPNPIQVDLRLSSGQVMDDGWGASDTIAVSPQQRIRIDGSHWNDSLIAPSGGADFQGNRGSDTLQGGEGWDMAYYLSSRLPDPTGRKGIVVYLGGVQNAADSLNAINSAKSLAWPSGYALPSGVTAWAIDNWGDIDVLTAIDGVEGSDWEDLIVGSDLANEFDGHAGADTIDGAGGVDSVEYNNAEAGVVVSLATGVATNDGAGFQDVLRNIENLRGSVFADNLAGDSGANQLRGEAGNDTLTGGAGSDSFMFPAGLRSTESGVAVGETDRVTDFAFGDSLAFDRALTLVSGPAGTLTAGQVRIEASTQIIGAAGSFNGATVLVGRDATAGADLTIQLPGVDASKLSLSADRLSVSLGGGVTPPAIQFSSTTSSANEGSSGSTTVSVQAVLSASTALAVTVPISYAGTASSGTDYTNAATTLTIAAGQTTGSATFAVVGDTVGESNETVILTMGTPVNAALGTNATFTHTIVNDDTAPPTAQPTGAFLPAGTHIALASPLVNAYGASGQETVMLGAGASQVVLDQNVDRVHLDDAPSAYLFQQTGNRLNVFAANGGERILTAALQTDADGTVIVFTGGSASATVGAGGMRLGGAIVPSTAPTAVVPTLGAAVAPPTGASTAGVFFASGANFTAASNGLKVYGAAGNEVVAIARGTSGIESNQLIERLQFNGFSTAALSFQQQGNRLLVFEGSTQLARSPLQGDADGTLITTTDGTMQAKVSSAGMFLGGTRVSSTAPSSVIPFEVDTTLKAPADRINVAITAAGTYNAAAADVTFSLASLNDSYLYTIAGFGAGDRITAPEGVLPSLDNENLTDGRVDLSFASGGKIVLVSLSGLTTVADSKLFSITDLNAVFGAATFG